jgi:hypothetical protein
LSTRFWSFFFLESSKIWRIFFKKIEKSRKQKRFCTFFWFIYSLKMPPTPMGGEYAYTPPRGDFRTFAGDPPAHRPTGPPRGRSAAMPVPHASSGYTELRGCDFFFFFFFGFWFSGHGGDSVFFRFSFSGHCRHSFFFFFFFFFFVWVLRWHSCCGSLAVDDCRIVGLVVVVVVVFCCCCWGCDFCVLRVVLDAR